MKSNLKETLKKEAEQKTDLANFLVFDELMTKPIKREHFVFLVQQTKEYSYCIAHFRKNFLRLRLKFSLGKIDDLMQLSNEAFENILNIKAKTFWVRFRAKYYKDYESHFKKIYLPKKEIKPTLKQQMQFINDLNPENKYERLQFV